MGVTVVTSGGSITVATSQQVLSTVPETWAEMVAQYGIGYNYPQPTGQTTIYRTGDDAWVEQNIFTAAVRAANSLKPRQSLANFTTLNNNNAFGNTNRFTDDAGGQDYTNDYVIDHYTGLGWYRVLQSAAVWNDAIDAALANTQNSFSDWFLGGTRFVFSISRQTSSIGSFDYAPFNQITTSSLWTSTTVETLTSFAQHLQNRSAIAASTKSSSLQYFICRKHY